MIREEWIVSDATIPRQCFPAALDTTGFIDVSQVIDYWAKFVDPATGQLHDCAEYAARMLAESA